MKNYKLVWREPSGRVWSSAVSYSPAAAEDREKELKAEGAAVRMVEVPLGRPVPETVLEEMQAGAAPAAA
ncbi:hypothetical protein ACFPFX_12355 [Streptomyces mauvecolor]|uniref:DUF1508 domain-containing protein n=1 Tax=Streptomyces mauvecolor TaxID=58345 RepID=A0ABV9UKK3_9ACTN